MFIHRDEYAACPKGRACKNCDENKGVYFFQIIIFNVLIKNNVNYGKWFRNMYEWLFKPFAPSKSLLFNNYCILQIGYCNFDTYLTDNEFTVKSF